MKCKYCGEEFEPNKYGRKKEYCNKEDCIRKAKNDTQKKWYAKKLDVLDGARSRIIKEKKVVYSSTDRAIETMKNEDFTGVIELARELGAVRFKIIEELKKCGQGQSVYDKEDQVFLHNIENLSKKDVVYEDEIVTLVKEHITRRQERREVKDKQEILQRLLQGIIVNPSAYVTEFIKKRDNRIYNPKIKERNLEG